MTAHYRWLSFFGFLACVIGMAFALYLEHFRGYEPCPMCIFQRVAMMAAGVVFLVAAVHAPKRAGRWVYAVLAALACGIGAAIAGRHVWLQSLPPDQVPACGPTLDYLLDMLPVMDVVTMVLKGDGNCAKIDAQWWGISLPGWTLIAFIGLALYALAMPVAARIAERRSHYISG
ncbi:Thiol:disulfide interchange protein DsbB [Fontimonas thermophila]|uniref:Disulfide bond formation protein B n=1 Tax=Fontimonas thermophila TaxID=1076937 RepID=A0A1I2HSD2_9GAMM|nr:disulfide bond formation protein B [Fontimonas thermophila]SFF33004.1 Thiol:disulfide interchange protein DsbB [Fontimonas thermophila]